MATTGESRGPTRRAFLAQAAGAAFALGLTACSDSDSDGGQDDGPILIIGGGLGGLRTLDQLRAHGRDAVLFEGAATLGGRIRTLREGLPQGLIAELGAERIPDSHPLLAGLLKEFGLKTIAAPYRPEYDLSLRIDGATHRFKTPADLPDSYREGLTEKERTAYPHLIHAVYVDAARPVADDDPRNALTWLEDAGMSPKARRITNALCYLPLELISAHDYWRIILRERNIRSSRRVEGGLDRLIHALAARNPDRIRLGTVITTIRQDERGVTVVDAAGTAHRGSMAVLALPLRPYEKLRFEPGEPASFAAYRKGLRIEREMKVHRDFAVRELEEKKLNANFMGLDFPRMTWACAEVSPDGRSLLNAMAIGPEIDRLKSLSADPAKALAILMNKRIPAITSFGPKVHVHDLNVEPLIGGTYAYHGAGAAALDVPVREGRLLVAGSDFSSRPGWMEGALESADAAVKEVLRT